MIQTLERTISLYHTISLVSFVLFVIFTALSVFMFFKFDIKAIFELRSGRGAKKEIERMEEINAQTGKLRVDYNYGNTGSFSQEFGKSNELPIQPKVESKHKQNSLGQTSIPESQQVSEETSVLNTGSAETSLLSGSNKDTLMVSAPVQQPVQQPSPEPVQEEVKEEPTAKPDITTFAIDKPEENLVESDFSITETLATGQEVTEQLVEETVPSSGYYDFSSAGETTVLSALKVTPQKEEPSVLFEIQKEIVWIHTDEVLDLN